MKNVVKLLATIPLVGVSALVHAGVTYSYIGSNFDSFYTPYVDPPNFVINPYGAMDHLTFEFSIDEEFQPNMPMTYISESSILKWSASDSHHFGVNTAVHDPHPSFFLYVATGEQGEIIDWSLGFRFLASEQEPYPGTYQFLSSKSGTAGGLHESILFMPSESNTAPPSLSSAPGYFDGSTSTGFWTEKPMTPVPEPEAYALALFGMALLWASKRGNAQVKKTS